MTQEFASLAHTMAANASRAGLRVHVLPYPLESQSEAEVRAIAIEHWPAVLATLGATEAPAETNGADEHSGA